MQAETLAPPQRPHLRPAPPPSNVRPIRAPRIEGIERAFHGSFDQVRELVPEFDRVPFAVSGDHLTAGIGGIANRFSDVIVRRASPLLALPAVPVGLVSKRYRLIGHGEVVDAVREAIRGLGVRPDSAACEAHLGRYGATMAFYARLPRAFDFDPGDGHPMALRVLALNSVDGGSPLTLLLGWYRFVCANGMIVGTTRMNWRIAHRAGQELGDLSELLEAGLELAEHEKLELQAWLRARVAMESLRSFADGPLAAAWGVKPAARFWHIAASGCDAEPALPFEAGAPTLKTMRALGRVPGAPERVRNAYDASQALAWLARQPRAHEERVKRMQEIPGLMAGLVDIA